ncbi:MAG: hypothetical protein SPJ14_05410, partial [Succinivibrio sp.]|nr:hypothetical protein [Succinivibrio sp.]
YRMSDLVVNIESKDKIALTRFRDKLRPIKLLILDDYGLTVYSDMVVSVTDLLVCPRICS